MSGTPAIGPKVAALMLVLSIAACQPEQKVTKYKPFFTGLGDAKFGTDPVNPNEGYVDPTAISPEEKIVITNDDGSRTFLSPSPRSVMTHVETLLDENTPEADTILVEQIISQKTIEHYQTDGKDPTEYVHKLHEQRKDIAKLFARMPMAEHSPTVLIDQPGDNMWVIKLTGAPTKGLKLTRIWVRLEKKQWKLVWID
jgi:hypothetical protein